MSIQNTFYWCKRYVKGSKTLDMNVLVAVNLDYVGHMLLYVIECLIILVFSIMFH